MDKLIFVFLPILLLTNYFNSFFIHKVILKTNELHTVTSNKLIVMDMSIDISTVIINSVASSLSPLRQVYGLQWLVHMSVVISEWDSCGDPGTVLNHGNARSIGKWKFIKVIVCVSRSSVRTSWWYSSLSISRSAHHQHHLHWYLFILNFRELNMWNFEIASYWSICNLTRKSQRENVLAIRRRERMVFKLFSERYCFFDGNRRSRKLDSSSGSVCLLVCLLSVRLNVWRGWQHLSYAVHHGSLSAILNIKVYIYGGHLTRSCFDVEELVNVWTMSLSHVMFLTSWITYDVSRHRMQTYDNFNTGILVSVFLQYPFFVVDEGCGRSPPSVITSRQSWICPRSLSPCGISFFRVWRSWSCSNFSQSIRASFRRDHVAEWDLTGSWWSSGTRPWRSFTSSDYSFPSSSFTLSIWIGDGSRQARSRHWLSTPNSLTPRQFLIFIRDQMLFWESDWDSMRNSIHVLLRKVNCSKSLIYDHRNKIEWDNFDSDVRRRSAPKYVMSWSLECNSYLYQHATSRRVF